MEPEAQNKGLLKPILSLVVIVAVVLVGYWALAPKKIETVKIGVIAPLTGNQATYGEGVKEGIDLAFAELKNQQFKGKSVHLVFEDTNGEVKNALSAAEKLISVDGVAAIISGGPSQEAVALAPLAEKYKMPIYMAISQAPELSDAGDFVFRGMPNIDLLGSKIAGVAYARGFKKAAMITANYNQATKAAAVAFRGEFISRGGTVVAEEEFGPNTSDFRSLLSRIHLKKPDVIFVNGLTADDGLIIKQVRELGITAALASQGSVEDKKVIETAGSGAEGLIFASFNAPVPDAFAEKIKAAYGKDPRRWNSEGYEALTFVFAGLAEAKTFDSQGLRDGFTGVHELEGVTSKLIYDEKGNVSRSVYVKKIENGKFVLLNE